MQYLFSSSRLRCYRTATDSQVCTEALRNHKVVRSASVLVRYNAALPSSGEGLQRRSERLHEDTRENDRRKLRETSTTVQGVDDNRT